MKKIKYVFLCGIILLGVCGCGNETSKINSETKKVISMINKVDFGINAPKINRNYKLYIDSVSKCGTQYQVEFYYYDYNNEMSEQVLITSENSDEFYNPIVDDNKFGVGGWGPLNDIYAYQYCLEDNRDGIANTFTVFSDEEIKIINDNIITRKNK